MRCSPMHNCVTDLGSAVLDLIFVQAHIMWHGAWDQIRCLASLLAHQQVAINELLSHAQTCCHILNAVLDQIFMNSLQPYQQVALAGA